MKVLLIHPHVAGSIEEASLDSFISRIASRILGMGETSYTPPLAALMLGAVTPSNIEVELVDERVDNLDFNVDVDLVGISVMTYTAPRAYQIADEFRSRGIRVVMGGIHPSALPDEASQHADSVVVGEGEDVWPQVLEDWQRETLKPIYRGKPQKDLDKLPFPRREMIRNPKKYAMTKIISATRGCPNTCTFCAAGVGLHKKFRVRSVENVISELEQVPGMIAGFVDDNIGWNTEYAKALFKAMIPLQLRWTGSLTINAFEDEELVKLASKSGCFMISFGFESLSTKTILGIRKQKTNQPERYATIIKRCQDAGIAVSGNFILGFDEENETNFPALIEFIERTNLESPLIYLLTPYPGSVLFKSLDRENRLLHKNWAYYDPYEGSCVYIPKQMSPGALLDEYIHIQEKVFSPRSYIPRLLRSPTRFSFGSLTSFHVNMESRQNIPTLINRITNYKRDVLSMVTSSS